MIIDQSNNGPYAQLSTTVSGSVWTWISNILELKKFCAVRQQSLVDGITATQSLISGAYLTQALVNGQAASEVLVNGKLRSQSLVNGAIEAQTGCS